MSDTALFTAGNPIVPWSTGSVWHCPFLLPGSLTTNWLSNDLQQVSYSSLLSTRHSHHISFHEHRLWVTVPLFCWCHYIIQWLTGSVWCCSFICHMVLSYHMTNRKSVTLPLFSTRQSHDITNSLWVPTPCFCKVVSSLVPWPTASEWTTLFLVSSDLISWQTGSGCPAYFYCHGFSWHLISWPTGSE